VKREDGKGRVRMVPRVLRRRGAVEGFFLLLKVMAGLAWVLGGVSFLKRLCSWGVVKAN
jgi:hypothetical protein